MNEGLVRDLLGCSLLQLERSYWALKREDGTWLCEKSGVHDFRRGESRLLDWGLDVAATDDASRIAELWLLCPPSRTSPMGNTARLPILRPYSAFSFKIGTSDNAGVVGEGRQIVQAHIIGRVDDMDGNCTCFAYDPVEDGLLTPETTVYDFRTGHILTNDDGTPYHPLKTNVHAFGWRTYSGRPVQGMWRESLAPLGLLAYERLGVRL